MWLNTVRNGREVVPHWRPVAALRFKGRARDRGLRSFVVKQLFASGIVALVVTITMVLGDSVQAREERPEASLWKWAHTQVPLSDIDADPPPVGSGAPLPDEEIAHEAAPIWSSPRVGPVNGAPAVPMGPLPSQPTVIRTASMMSNMGARAIGDVGGLSGLIALDPAGTSFVAVTDRGPNRDIRVGGKKAVSFLEPRFQPSIVKLRLDQAQLRVVERIPMRLSWGADVATGGAEVSGLPNSGRDEAAYDADALRLLPTDPNGIDPEGIAIDPRDGSFWICEEYGPSILHVAPNGTILTRLVPIGLDLGGAGYEIREVLPAILLQRKKNRGFEGLAISPDGRTLFAVMQSPLSIPNEKGGEASRQIRLVAIDVSSAPATAAMYLYQAERAELVGAAEQDDVKVGDLAAVTATHLLVSERDGGVNAHHRMVYLVELEGATDIKGRSFFNKPLEAMSDSDLANEGITPVTKRPAADLASLGFGHSFIEGLAVVDEATIAIVNDDNFDPAEPTELMVIRLPAPLR